MLPRVLVIGFVLAAGSVLPAALVPPQEDIVPSIMDKATAYLSDYVKALSSVVAEERYEQVVRRLVERGAAPPERDTARRVLVSEYLLIQVPKTVEWVPFRDVFSVDGVPVRDRDDRLMKLLLEPNSSGVKRALQIREESSRYNIGNVTRDINIPTFALQILSREMRGDFRFELHSRERRAGEPETIVIDYAETAKRTMIRGRENAPVPAFGRFWINAETGAVLRTLLEVKPAGMSTRMEVVYEREPRLEIFVPVEMSERHDIVNESIEGRATYSKFRRFKVDTSFEIK